MKIKAITVKDEIVKECIEDDGTIDVLEENLITFSKKLSKCKDEINFYLKNENLTFEVFLEEPGNMNLETLVSLLKFVALSLENSVKCELEDNIYLVIDEFTNLSIEVSITNKSNYAHISNRIDKYKFSLGDPKIKVNYKFNNNEFVQHKSTIVEELLDEYVCILYNNLLFIGKNKGDFENTLNDEDDFISKDKDFLVFLLPLDDIYIDARKSICKLSSKTNFMIYLVAFLQINFNKLNGNSGCVKIRKISKNGDTRYLIHELLLLGKDYSKINVHFYTNNLQFKIAKSHYISHLLEKSDDPLSNAFISNVLKPLKEYEKFVNSNG